MKYLIALLAGLLAIFCVICLIGGAQEVFGQNTGALLPDVIPVYPNLSGSSVAANGFLCTTVSGSTTLLATYQDAALTTPNQNPIRLNPAGRPINGTAEVSVFMQPQAYRVTLYAAGTGTPNCVTGAGMGSVIRTVDHVYDWALVNGALTAPSALTAGRIPYTTGAHSLADTPNLTWENSTQKLNGAVFGHSPINLNNSLAGTQIGAIWPRIDQNVYWQADQFVFQTAAGGGSPVKMDGATQFIIQSTSKEVAGQWPVALAAPAVMGNTSITLTSAAGVYDTMSAFIELDNGSGFTTFVSGAPVGSVVTLGAAMPSAAGAGRRANFTKATTLSMSASGGATTITVPNTVTLAMGDLIRVQVDTGAMLVTTVVSVIGNVITLTDALPSSANAGNFVMKGNYDVSPDFILSRAVPAGTAGDLLANIEWTGPSSAASGPDTPYGQLYMTVTNGVSGMQGAKFNFGTVQSGGLQTRWSIGAGLYSENAPGGDKGEGAVNAPQYWGASMLLGSSGVQFSPSNGATRLSINNNTSTGEASVSGLTPVVHIQSKDNVAETFLWDSFGTNNSFTFRRANGTAASPTHVLDGEDLGHICGSGYATTAGYVGCRSAVEFHVTEPTGWGNGNQGSDIQFWTTPIGSTTPALAAKITDNGGNGAFLLNTASTDFTSGIMVSRGTIANVTAATNAQVLSYNASGGDGNAQIVSTHSGSGTTKPFEIFIDSTNTIKSDNAADGVCVRVGSALRLLTSNGTAFLDGGACPF